MNLFARKSSFSICRECRSRSDYPFAFEQYDLREIVKQFAENINDTLSYRIYKTALVSGIVDWA